MPHTAIAASRPEAYIARWKPLQPKVIDGAVESFAVTPRIVVVGDDPIIRTMLTKYLGENGMRVVATAGRLDLVGELKSEPSLVVLDLDLGAEDGFDLLRLIRTASDVPVVIVSGQRRDEIDRVLGLELGADDYITKPFSLRELLARTKAILRRRTLGLDTPSARARRKVRFGPWELDRDSRRLEREGAASVRLTKGEYALLHAFLEAPQRPLSREHLLRATRVHEDIFDRSIDVQVLRLRRKLAPQPNMPQLIETVRGLGYVFRAQVEAP